MQPTSVTLNYNGAEFVCNLAEVNPDYIFLELGFCEEPRIGPEDSMIFNDEEADKLNICGMEIRSSEDLLRGIVYYVKVEQPYHLRELIESMYKMRRDYVYVNADNYDIICNNPYKYNVENTLLIDGGIEMHERIYSIAIEGDYNAPYFSSPPLNVVYNLCGPCMNRDLVKHIITEQKVIPVKPTEGYVLKLVTPCTFRKFLRLFIIAFNRYMELPISRNKSAAK